MAVITRAYLNKIDNERFSEIFESAWEDHVSIVNASGRDSQTEFLLRYFGVKEKPKSKKTQRKTTIKQGERP
jgi:hypothetical protein